MTDNNSSNPDFLDLLKELEATGMFKGAGQDVLFNKLKACCERQELEKNLLLNQFDNQSREMRRLQASMGQLDKIKKEFVSVCAHDLKSPTNNIISFVDILNRDWQSMSKKEIDSILERIQRAGNQMMSLIANLLDMSHIESGKQQFEPRPMLLSQLCQEALAGGAAKFANKEIHTELHVQRGELRVSIDSQKGSQIINNLLGNALKFTPRGGQVGIYIVPNGRSMVMEIRDSGQGIPEEEQQKLFKQFSKTSTRATEGEAGSGLGLSIVHQLVDMHHGGVTVSSQKGRGSSFFVSLPCAEAPALLKLFSGRK